MKQFVINIDGSINSKAKSTTPEQLYGTYDKSSFQLHLSETELTSKDQILAISSLLDKAAGNKAPQRVKQRSKNVIAFSLRDEPDAAKADTAKQAAYNDIVAEARKVNKDLKAAQGNNSQQQTPPPGSGQQQQTPPPSGGQQAPPSGGNQQQTPPSGGNQQQTPPPGSGQQQTPPSGGQQQTPPPGGGQQQTPPPGNGQSPAFDKTKDVFGRPLKQSYPGLFWPGMTAQEEKDACDRYWKMVRDVDYFIFHRP